MNQNILIIFTLCAIAAAIIYISTRNKKQSNTSVLMMDLGHAERISGKDIQVGCDWAYKDENNVNIVESREIHQIPTKAHNIDITDGNVHRIKHLASDLFKGASSIQNKTVEIVFKNDIQKGLAEGTYKLMNTKTGEVLADAVDSSGKIVGKGRVIEAGKMRQLASGAFQLVSIAVAQSHLADIEKSLSSIKDSISELLIKHENEDKSRITGAFDYLSEIAQHMKELRSPDELSQQKKNAIEGIIRDSYTWRNKLKEEATSLINQINKLEDMDTFGTGSTYERLTELTIKIEPLLKRHRLLLELASATNFITTYLDPTNLEFSKIEPNTENWVSIIDEFKRAVFNKKDKLISKSLWNSNETLQLRGHKIETISNNYHRTSLEQQHHYIAVHQALEKNVGSLFDCNGNVHVAISFDDKGEVRKAAII